MSDNTSKMRQEILEIPQAAARLLADGAIEIRRIADELRTKDPAFAISIARGSSDHACSYFKYASEILLGVPVCSVGPSVASIYKAPLKLKNSVSLAVSQSGKSPDIVEMARAARRDGAFSIALTNNPSSDLARVCQETIDIHAGPELSVAATKTFVNSVVAGLMLLAEWSEDAKLQAALVALPGHLAKAAALDWPEVRAAIGAHKSLFTLGRGPGWAISNEAALKFKETCQIHAESYSSAEVLHGPVSIVGEGFPVLCFASGDAAESAVVSIADEIAAKGAVVFVTSDKAHTATQIPSIRTGHPLTDPLCLMVSFYAMVERFALAQGNDPDAPRHLRKVTETI
jgi:glucosamine--fructose-6-phosphate aminotransferase (isomerizing)